MLKVALLLPAATVTLAGTVTDDELSLRETATPPAGAAPLRVTVPWELPPPARLAGLRARALNTGGATVRVAVLVTPA